MYRKVPKALFNSKALFNPYQYLLFKKVLNWDGEKKIFIANGKNVLVTDEVGVGKTFEIGILLRELLHWNSELTVLILCPVKLCENWEKELKENFYIGATNYYREKTFGQITILPYSYFSSSKTKTIAEDIKLENEMKNATGEATDFPLPEELEDILPYDILVLDEAHYVRNRGKIWGYVNQLIEESEKEEAKTKVFMTGTPVFNNEEDYEHITELLSKELPQGNVQKFGITKTLQSEANCYDKLLKISVWNYSGTASDEIGQNRITSNDKNGITPNREEQDIIRELYAIVEKEDERGEVREVSKYGQLTGFLKRIASSSIFSLNKFVKNREEFAQDISENDIDWEKDFEQEDSEQYDFDLKKSELNGYLDRWNSESDTKMKALENLIHSKFEEENSNKKAIIFSCFIVTCKYIEERLKENYHVYMITGETNAKHVENAKAMFEKDEKPAILICSDAAKEGHNLQVCQILIHYDLPYTPAAIGQRNGRIYRRGQEGTPNAYYMLLNKGYDQRLFGEIIVGKCQVIKDLNEQEKLSWVNILPEDANEYMKQCTKKYIEEKLGESGKEKEDKSKSAKAFLEKQFSEIELDDSGKKKKDEQGKTLRKWNYEKAKELYDEIDSERIIENEIIDKITELFTCDEAREESSTLQKYYKERYKDNLKEFLKKYLEAFCEKGFDFCDWDGCDPEAVVIGACRKIVGERDTKYCHDMIDATLSILDYKQQFEPLKEWEHDANGNNK